MYINMRVGQDCVLRSSSMFLILWEKETKPANERLGKLEANSKSTIWERREFQKGAKGQTVLYIYSQ